MGKGKYGGRRAAAFIFDLDGTLVDSGRDIAASANFTRAHFRLPELPEDTLRGYVGDGVQRLLQRALGHDVHTGLTGQAGLPVGEERLGEALAVFADHYGRHLLDNTRAYPGVLEVLLRFQAFPLHVATNKPRRFALRILEELHLDGAFRRVVGGDDVPARKPDPGHLRACLEGLDVPVEQVVVVGDSPNDVLAARALGAVSVGCTFGLVPARTVKAAGPDLVLDRFEQLAELFPSRRS